MAEEAYSHLQEIVVLQEMAAVVDLAEARVDVRPQLGREALVCCLRRVQLLLLAVKQQQQQGIDWYRASTRGRGRERNARVWYVR